MLGRFVFTNFWPWALLTFLAILCKHKAKDEGVYLNSNAVLADMGWHQRLCN